MDVNTALTLYKSDCSSLRLRVFVEVSPQYQLNRLQTIQHAAARLILLEEYDCPVYELHERLKLDTLATRRAKSMVRITVCCLHNQQPLDLLEQLKAVRHQGLPTRSMEANVFQIPRTTTRYGQMAYGFRGPMQWNVTNPEFKAAVNVIQLKNLLKNNWYHNR